VPAFAAPAPDERTQLLGYLAAQRSGVRAALRGLTEEQARSTPTASSMSLAGLVRHLVRTERRWVVAGIADRPAGLYPVTDWAAEWRLGPDDTVEHLLAEYAAVAAETEAVLAGVPDVGVPCGLPDCQGWPVRWVLLHLIEETARHAGHADVIRESIDGATADHLDG
jgi:hypothetical protein